MKTRRVLHVLGALERGGVEAWLLDLAGRLGSSGWQFDFCTLAGQPGRDAVRAERHGAQVFSCPVRAPGFTRRFYRLLTAQRPEVLHSHVHCFSAVVLAVAAAARIPVRVAHSHNTADGQLPSLGRCLYRRATRGLLRAVLTGGLACSEDAAEALFGTGWRRDPRVAVLPYGVSLTAPVSPTRRGQIRRALGLAGATPVIAHVGRLERQKNHVFLLQVAAALTSLLPEAVWLLAGDGELRARLESLRRELGLEDRVRLLGRRDDVPELLAASDAFVLPSLHEGLPLALLEAQATGLRAVVSAKVTPQAAAVDRAVEFVPLEAGARVWAERVQNALAAGRIPKATARKQLRAAGFAAEQSLERLVGCYDRACSGGRPLPGVHLNPPLAAGMGN